jgi:hypothetical protein
MVQCLANNYTFVPCCSKWLTVFLTVFLTCQTELQMILASLLWHAQLNNCSTEHGFILNAQQHRLQLCMVDTHKNAHQVHC